MIVLWVLIGLAVILSVASVRGEGARIAYYRAGGAPLRRLPAVTVIVPVKGMDEGLRENLWLLGELEYPDYELLVTVKSRADLPDGVMPAGARLVVAGEGEQGTGEKINNLLAAVRAARTESEIYVFADSDGRVCRGWLRALLAELEDPGVGAATGYRWHLPAEVGVWAMLRSVWNAVIAGGMGPGKNNFCWGGAMAIRKKTFWELNVPAWWKGAVSDDYRLSEAVKAAGLRIAFAPGALVAAVDGTGGWEFLGWIRRQMMITRFYAPGLWKLALFAHVVYCGAMAGAGWLAMQGSKVALAALAVQLGMGWYKAANRLRMASWRMPEHAWWFARYGWLHTLLVPLGTWLWLYACVAAGVSDAIDWRGYRIRLRRLPPVVAVLCGMLAQAQAPAPAFPGAEGAGAMATGGRGGTVVRVTNLRASGPGSLADALSEGNRIVVFAVGGVIDLEGRTLHVKHPNVTIAGQSAPGEGITLVHGALSIGAGNVIVRYVRVRRGHWKKGNMGDGITVKGEFENVIVDHVSAAWATDENLTLTSANRVTGQWFINAEAMDYFNTGQSPNRHGFGSLFGSQTPDGRMTIHHSIYAHNRLRNARTTGGDHGKTPPVLDFVNNVIYDSKEMASHTGSQQMYGNWVGNVLKDGPSTGIEGHDARGVLFTFLHHAGSRLFLDGNWIIGHTERTVDNWKAVRYGRGLEESAAFRAAERFPAPPVTLHTAREAYAQVLEDAGATLPARDVLDTRIVREIREGTGAVLNYETDLPEQARWQVLESLPGPADRDEDGMPDAWENAHGFDARDGRDAMADADGDGYVNVEEYLNNTDPRGGTKPVVFVSAWDARGHRVGDEPAVFKFWRNGDRKSALRVAYRQNGRLTELTVPAGERNWKVTVRPSQVVGERRVVMALEENAAYTVGLPRQALAVMEEWVLPAPVDVRKIDPRGGATEEEYRIGAEKMKTHSEARPEKLRKRKAAAQEKK